MKDHPDIVRQRQRERLIEGNRGLTGFLKLLGQVEILNRRIRQYMDAIDQPNGFFERHQELLLDTETFYTVANDALKLVALFLPEAEATALRKDRRYIVICASRSCLVRHAYDKEYGDPYNGFAYDAVDGLILKGGSSGANVTGDGYVKHYSDFWNLLEDCNVLRSRQPLVITNKVSALFTGAFRVPHGESPDR